MFARKLFPLLIVTAILIGCSDATVRQTGVTKKRYHTKNVPNARTGRKYKNGL